MGGRTRSRWALLLVAGALVVTQLALGSCAPPEPVTAQAMAFYSAMTADVSERTAAMARYLPPEAVLDAGAVSNRVLESRAEQIRYLTQWFGPAMDELDMHALYVDHEGAVVWFDSYLTWDHDGPPASAVLSIDQVSAEGLHHRALLPSTAGPSEFPDSPVYAQAESIADAHRRTWDSQDPSGLESLYAPAARLTDTLDGLDVTGAAAVRDVLVGGPRPWALSEGPIPGAPLVFLDRADPYSSPLEAVAYLADVGSQPRSLAIYLELDADARVVSERRLHRADSVLADPLAGVQTAWWDGLQPPPPPARQPATQLGGPYGPVAVRNGDAAVDSLLRWALGRFAIAGLGTPVLDEVVVDPYGQVCEAVSGVAVSSPDGGSITLCHDRDSICASTECTQTRRHARQSALHEMAHVWIAQHLAESDRAAFVAGQGLSTWNSPEFAWGERGEEWAAEVVSWGLMDEPVVLHRIGNPDPADLVKAFAALTGAPPLVPAQE